MSNFYSDHSCSAAPQKSNLVTAGISQYVSKVEKPKAVQIISPSENGFELEEQILRDILLRPEIDEKKCCLISVAGAVRKGKSCLLNFFVKYLESQDMKSQSDGWCTHDSVLDAFPWRSGSHPETQGISIYSKPFIRRDSDGDEVAVFLMDTQGTFDSQSSLKECTAIFALSTLLSSLQIYNLSSNLQEDDLQHLNLFTNYAHLPGNFGDKQPFQELLFLLRDWPNSKEFAYGFRGGRPFLAEKLAIKASQKDELQELRRDIRQCFKTLDCFLMPHPGLALANNHNSNKLGEVEPEFLEQMKKLVLVICDKSNLAVKTVFGHKITCKELMQYFKSYTKILTGDTLPEPKSILNRIFLATAEVLNINAFSDTKDSYQECIDSAVYTDPPLSNSRKLELIHEQAKKDALAKFDRARKLGGKLMDKYRHNLNEYIHAYHKNAKKIVQANEELENRKLDQERQEKVRAAQISADKERLKKERREEEARLQAERERLRVQQEELNRQRREDERRAKERREEEARLLAEKERLRVQQEELDRKRRENERRDKERREEEERRRERESCHVGWSSGIGSTVFVPSLPLYSTTSNYSPPRMAPQGIYFDQRMGRGHSGRWVDAATHRMVPNPFR